MRSYRRFLTIVLLAIACTAAALQAQDRQSVANCVLPPVATHNLIAASELALAEDDLPTRLHEALVKKIDFKIQHVSLLQAIDELAQKANAAGDGAFQLQILISGKDLIAEGITRNQRIKGISARQKPVAEILTEILMQANPDKSVMNPSDEAQKLVFVLRTDPVNVTKEPFISITTREAAKQKGYHIAPQFRSRRDAINAIPTPRTNPQSR
ncbi:MAG: hypothetical protein IH991_14405 [Planctomycetes bacterium]|nr:hypothetical protein [Planctomycetota bacterium]